MSAAEREQVGHAFGQLAGRLPAGQSLQFYVEATPVRLDALLERSETDADQAIQAQGCDGDRAGALRRLHAALRESLERHADEQAAVDSPTTSSSRTCLTSGPSVDWRRCCRGGRRRLGSAALERSLAVASARRARVAAPDRLDPRRPGGARPLHPPARPAPRCSTCCGGASTRPPPIARRTAARARARSASRSSASSTPSPTPARPPGPRRRCASWSRRRGSTGPTSATCASTATSSRRSTSPRCRTRPSSGGCWTRCRSRAPFTLSVHVHALDRLRERSRFKARHRRLFGVNRGAELRGRTPDYEMLAQEEELGELLKELSGHERSARV